MNSGRPRTNPASGQSRTRTRDRRISTTRPRCLILYSSSSRCSGSINERALSNCWLFNADVTWARKLASLQMFAFQCWKRQPQLAGIKIRKSWPTWTRRFALSPDPLFEETLKDPQMDGLFVDETNGTGLLFCYSCAFSTCGLENSDLDFVRTHRAN